MPVTIEDEIARLGHLRSTGAAIVDYVRALSKDSEFQEDTGWTLRPDNWIAIRFAYLRGANKTVSVTLGVPRRSLPDTTGLHVRVRRTWSRILISSVTQLPAALRSIEYAYYHARNRHRNAY